MRGEMKYFSMFSGIGGFERGINEAYLHKYESKEPKETNSTPRGVRNTGQRSAGICASDDPPLCIGYSEIDKYAIQIYQKHFKGHKNYGDCTKIDWASVPNFDLLVGGFPCQAFSIAGKRGGFTDTRGTLFFEIARCLKEKQPRLFLLENVKGLLSHDKGNTFLTILATLDELGYDLQWQVLNSKNFGVPQNRERVFIVGHLRGIRRPEVFPIGEVSSISDKAYGRKSESGKGIRSEISSTIDARYGALRNAGETYFWDVYNNKIQEHAASLTEPHHNSARLVAGAKIRKLTPTECERLQGFPDGWTEYGIDQNGNEVKISDTQRYKTLGNAISVPVVEEIMRRIWEDSTI